MNRSCEKKTFYGPIRIVFGKMNAMACPVSIFPCMYDFWHVFVCEIFLLFRGIAAFDTRGGKVYDSC